jgi:hypothetical protein
VLSIRRARATAGATNDGAALQPLAAAADLPALARAYRSALARELSLSSPPETLSNEALRAALRSSVSDPGTQFLCIELLDELDRAMYAPPGDAPPPLADLKRRMQAALKAMAQK